MKHNTIVKQHSSSACPLSARVGGAVDKRWVKAALLAVVLILVFIRTANAQTQNEFGPDAGNDSKESRFNTAFGWQAFINNLNGAGNVAFGWQALGANRSGNNNIALGFNAGSSLVEGDNNIYIGNVGLESESGIIRIGTRDTHQAVFVAGINGVAVKGLNAVIVDSKDQLGTMSLENFTGPPGPQGIQGVAGIQGTNGLNGINGYGLL